MRPGKISFRPASRDRDALAETLYSQYTRRAGGTYPHRESGWTFNLLHPIL